VTTSDEGDLSWSGTIHVFPFAIRLNDSLEWFTIALLPISRGKNQEGAVIDVKNQIAQILFKDFLEKR